MCEIFGKEKDRDWKDWWANFVWRNVTKSMTSRDVKEWTQLNLLLYNKKFQFVVNKN